MHYVCIQKLLHYEWCRWLYKGWSKVAHPSPHLRPDHLSTFPRAPLPPHHHVVYSYPSTLKVQALCSCPSTLLQWCRTSANLLSQTWTGYWLSIARYVNAGFLFPLFSGHCLVPQRWVASKYYYLNVLMCACIDVFPLMHGDIWVCQGDSFPSAMSTVHTHQTFDQASPSSALQWMRPQVWLIHRKCWVDFTLVGDSWYTYSYVMS